MISANGSLNRSLNQDGQPPQMWVKNEANDRTDSVQLVELAHDRVTRLMSRMGLETWLSDVEVVEVELPHPEGSSDAPSRRPTIALRLGHSCLYRTVYQQLNVWALAVPQQSSKALTQVLRDTEFIGVLGPALDCLFRHFVGRVLRVDKRSAILKEP